MRTTATRRPSIPPTPDHGEVESREGDGYRVVHEGGALTAQRAFSCLVEPEPGDRVLLAAPSDGQVYILAILTRAGSAPARLSAPGDLELSAPSGSVRVASAAGSQ